MSDSGYMSGSSNTEKFGVGKLGKIKYVGGWQKYLHTTLPHVLCEVHSKAVLKIFLILQHGMLIASTTFVHCQLCDG